MAKTISKEKQQKFTSWYKKEYDDGVAIVYSEGLTEKHSVHQSVIDSPIGKVVVESISPSTSTQKASVFWNLA